MALAAASPSVVLRAADGGGWLAFHRPREVVSARTPAEVLPALRYLEEAVHGKGLHAAGLLSYEAAPGLDSALAVLRSPDFPLVWFGLYDSVERAGSLPGAPEEGPAQDWRPTVSREEYEQAVRRIQDRIRVGDSYQVNYTYRLRSAFYDDPWSWFLRHAGPPGTPYAAYVDLGRWAVSCLSPELFFLLDNGSVVSRPMKGTAPRGLTPAEDEERARWLADSEKNRAENVMIVDMIRNDMGRVADPGSVRVSRLCDVERYPTVLQMTSTVTARVSAPPSEILRAMFPCASVTGAPKVSTMGIITQAESAPRGVYTGSIGCLLPDGNGIRAQFNVAIRTAVIDRSSRTAEYGVGGGILWESDPAEEYRECEIKSRVLRAPPLEVDLLEALLWTPAEGYFLLERHVRRLSESARYFGIPFDETEVRSSLRKAAEGLADGAHKVRLVLSSLGAPTVTAQALEAVARSPVQRVRLAGWPVRSSEVVLYHKTARREVFERARREHPDCDDVILWNERSEITESCTANVVAEIDGRKVTPPVSCGLLAGTFRAHLLAQGEITERVITRDELRASRSIWLVNSVRRWMPAVLADG